MVTIKRKRHADHFSFSAEAIEAYKAYRALDDLVCTCPPEPTSHCPTCTARNRAATKINVLGDFRPWWRSEQIRPRMAALAVAAGFFDEA